jgi:hypothetical protein
VQRDGNAVQRVGIDGQRFYVSGNDDLYVGFLVLLEKK